MFDRFERFDIDTGDCTLHGVRGGDGAPLLLLHGYPQTHAMWHRVAPPLAERFSVIAPDLRGYGRSGKPASDDAHAAYSKRRSALDLVGLMDALGHDRFAVVAHDRGARVAHRLALDHAARVERLVVLDIAPTREMYRETTDAFARSYWHWFFLIQPPPFPERLIGADPDGFLRHKLGSGSAGLSPFAPDALDEYTSAFRNPDTVRASCEDYRAAASIDIAHDDADGDRRVECPVLALWGRHGAIEAHFDALALWRERASDVRGWALDGGHYLAEECPEALLDALIPFLQSAGAAPSP